MGSSGEWVPASETRYLYDGMLLLQERSNANNPLVTYTRGADLSGSLDGAGGIGGLLSRGAHATTSPYGVSTSAHYHADGNGNVTMLVGSGSPSVKAYYKYDPFGQTLASGGSLASANSMRFSSKPVMGSSGLYYYGYRFYDPKSQRWLNRDPIGEIGGINLTAFICNRSPNRIDLYGFMDTVTFTIYSCVRMGKEAGWCVCQFSPDTPDCERQIGNCLNLYGKMKASQACACLASQIPNVDERNAFLEECDKIKQLEDGYSKWRMLCDFFEPKPKVPPPDKDDIYRNIPEITIPNPPHKDSLFKHLKRNTSR